MEPQHSSYRDNLNSKVAQTLIDAAHAYANTQHHRAEDMSRSRARWRTLSLAMIILFGIVEPLLLNAFPFEPPRSESRTVYADAGPEQVSGVEVHVVPAYCHLTRDPFTAEDPFAAMRCELFPSTLFSLVRREPPRAVCTHKIGRAHV